MSNKLSPMLKIKLYLEAEEDIINTGWKKGETLELINDICDKNIGIAYYPLDKRWKITKVEILELNPN